jgi:hypothetical protein
LLKSEEGTRKPSQKVSEKPWNYVLQPRLRPRLRKTKDKSRSASLKRNLRLS